MATPSPALRLTRLRIKNFRSIGEADIALGPLTVLVGPNGAGKSNVVDALRFLRDCFSKGLDQAVLDREGLKALQHWSSSKQVPDVGLGITVANEWDTTVSYDLALAADAKGSAVVKREEIRLETDDQTSVVLAERGNLSIGQDGKPGRRLLFRSGERESSHLRGPGGLALGIYLLNREESAHNEELAANGLQKKLELDLLCNATQDWLQNPLFYALNPA